MTRVHVRDPFAPEHKLVKLAHLPWRISYKLLCTGPCKEQGMLSTQCADGCTLAVIATLTEEWYPTCTARRSDVDFTGKKRERGTRIPIAFLKNCQVGGFGQHRLATRTHAREFLRRVHVCAIITERHTRSYLNRCASCRFKFKVRTTTASGSIVSDDSALNGVTDNSLLQLL